MDPKTGEPLTIPEDQEMAAVVLLEYFADKDNATKTAKHLDLWQSRGYRLYDALQILWRDLNLDRTLSEHLRWAAITIHSYSRMTQASTNLLNELEALRAKRIVLDHALVHWLQVVAGMKDSIVKAKDIDK